MHANLFIPLALLTLNTFLVKALDDPYIVCYGGPPSEQEHGMWPPGRPPEDYYDNIDLCSDAYGIRLILLNGLTVSRNVGCRCPTSNTALVCNPNVADEYLYNWPLRPTGYSFPLWCMEHCRCTLQSIADGYYEANLLGEAIFMPIGQIGPTNGVVPYDPNYYSDPSDEEPSDVESSNLNTTHISHSQQCGGSCSEQSDCSGPGHGTGCTCRTNSSTIIPNKNGQPLAFQILFSALCAASVGGRRDELEPCPCNSTYVSYACCSSSDGMVWEPEENKLGELYVDGNL